MAGSTFTFKALAESDDAAPAENPVTLLVPFLSEDNAILAVQGGTPVYPNILTTSPGTANDGCLVGDARDGLFSEHSVDTTAIQGKPVRVQF